MGETRYINDEYQHIAQEVIEEYNDLAYLRGGDIQIILLSSDAEKKKGSHLVFGVCEKIPDKYKWSIPCDFTITIFDNNIAEFSDEQLRILIFHELLHVGVDGDRLFVREHDLEDFKEIIDRFGTHWSEPGWEQMTLDDVTR